MSSVCGPLGDVSAMALTAFQTEQRIAAQPGKSRPRGMRRITTGIRRITTTHTSGSARSQACTGPLLGWSRSRSQQRPAKRSPELLIRRRTTTSCHRNHISTSADGATHGRPTPPTACRGSCGGSGRHHTGLRTLQAEPSFGGPGPATVCSVAVQTGDWRKRNAAARTRHRCTSCIGPRADLASWRWLQHISGGRVDSAPHPSTH